MTIVTTRREQFDHWKLDVYKLAREFFLEAWELGKRFRREDVVIRSQFLRAALSIQLNIAEGSADYHPKEKAHFYRIARRSAHECCAVLDNLDVVLGIPIEKLDPYYHRLMIIISKLVQLDKSMMARAKSSSPRKRGQ